MKKILTLLALTALFSLAFVSNNYAQDQWTQGRGAGIYSVGIGGTQGIGIYRYNDGFGNTATYHGISPIGLSINASGEYKVWKFIGLGWQTGLDFFFSSYYGYNVGYGTVGNTYIGIPFIAKCNVHILDAVGGVSIADKLDVYAGLSFGGGPAFGTQSGSPVIGFINVGPQVGVRYWIIPKVAVFGEFGWGATFANIGFSF